jgi:hypothetical protein
VNGRGPWRAIRKKLSLDGTPDRIRRLGGREMIEQRHPQPDLFALRPAGFALFQMQFDAARLARSEFAFDLRGQLIQNVLAEHRYPFWPIRLFNRPASILCPRLKREATVPIEQ